MAVPSLVSTIVLLVLMCSKVRCIDPANTYCAFDSECIVHSHCVSNRCVCDYGYYSVKDQQLDKCIQKLCIFDLECAAFDSGSVCDDGTCVCPNGYDLDSTTQKCIGADKAKIKKILENFRNGCVLFAILFLLVVILKLLVAIWKRVAAKCRG